MILEPKTLERLRVLINEESEYRKGHEIVTFFNELGLKDTDRNPFPSRWVYTDEMLRNINGAPEIDRCIKKVFAPVNFVGRFNDLDKLILEFNKYLAFDGWQVVRQGKEINFRKAGEINFADSEPKAETNESDFLNHEFKDFNLDSIGLDGTITEVLTLRFEEIKKCLTSDAPLSVIFMCGSTLEGILLGVALKKPKEFNQANSSPKDKEGKVKPIHEWTLSNLINVAADLGLLKEDVKKFSHSLRDFRNFIHPYEQLSSRFNPDKHTAKISWQVLKAAVVQLGNN